MFVSLLLATASAGGHPLGPGVHVWRAGWFQVPAGLAVLGAGLVSDNSAVAIAGGAIAATAPITQNVGAAMATARARRLDRRLTAAPVGWGFTATGMCYVGAALNVATYAAPIPPVADCASAFVLPAWQMGLNAGATSHRRFEEDEEEPPRDLTMAPRPWVALAPLPAKGGGGLALVGAF